MIGLEFLRHRNRFLARVRRRYFRRNQVTAGNTSAFAGYMLDGNKVHRKAESSSCEAKIVRIGAESLKIFPNRPDKGTNGLSFFALEGKIGQWI